MKKLNRRGFAGLNPSGIAVGADSTFVLRHFLLSVTSA
jgi:hypothetical protein